MKHFGDITKLNGANLPVVDVITGGSPCQDLSQAGSKVGLAGERSGLFMEQIRIVREMRERDKADGRLTPLECTRLQGFPDDWVEIGDWVDSKGKKHKDADSPKYKALGNSIALPFWFYLLRRISAQYERPATLGSLFDGIGGFPLCWERCNGAGTAVWASEIDEFCIAVTKKHFPEEGEEDGSEIR